MQVYHQIDQINSGLLLVPGEIDSILLLSEMELAFRKNLTLQSFLFFSSLVINISPAVVYGGKHI